MTTFAGPTTYIVIDREKGIINVYDIKTGKLLYPLKIDPCIKSQ